MKALRREQLEYEGAAVVFSVLFHIAAFVLLLNYNADAAPGQEKKPFRFKMVSHVDMPLLPLPVDSSVDQKLAQPSREVSTPKVEKFVAKADLSEAGKNASAATPVPAPAIPDQLQIGALPTRNPSTLDSAKVNRAIIAIENEKPNRPMLDAPRTVSSAQEMAVPTAITEEMLTSKRAGIGGTGTYRGAPTQSLAEIFGLGAKTAEQLLKDAVVPPPLRPASTLPALPLEPYVQTELFTWHDPADPNNGFFQIRISSKEESPLRVIPKDVIYIMDVSGSIGTVRIEQFKAGVSQSLARLNPNDRFNIIRFRQDVGFVSPTLLPASEEGSPAVRQFVEKLHSMGSTDFFASLLPLAQLNREPGRLLMAVLMSDGMPTAGVQDTLQILHRFTQINAGRTAVFTFAGGKEIDPFLLGFLAYRNQGQLNYVATPEAMGSSFTRIQMAHANPLLLDVGFRFSGVKSEEVYPRLLPHFFREAPLSLYGRFTREDGKRLALQIRGESADGRPMEMTVVRDFPEKDNGLSTIANDWAQQKVNHLIAQWIDTGNKAYQDEAVTLAHRFGVPVSKLRK